MKNNQQQRQQKNSNLPNSDSLIEDMGKLEQCFRVLFSEKKPEELMIPACVQFKVKNITEVNFQNLSAKVNGALCISFLVFTHNKYLKKLLLDRLYWNPEEQKILEVSRKKKIERKSNFLPVTFNKDITVKLPTTRMKEFQIQAFKTRVTYEKEGLEIKGWRIFHVIRKEFTIEIVKSAQGKEFFAPFNFINLDLTLSLDHMEIKAFEYQEEANQQCQRNYIQKINTHVRNRFEDGREKKQSKKNKGEPEVVYKQSQQTQMKIKRLSFNILRIEEPLKKNPPPNQNRKLLFSPMIVCSSLENFGKYDIAENKMQAYSYDEREVIDIGSSESKEIILEDNEPTQLNFKPFKYAIFKIPLFRYPVIDILAIFIPLWLLAFISIYVFYQTTEIMNRIINVAAIMIAYAGILPIARKNINTISVSLVDYHILGGIYVNILFLVRSITIRNLFDDDTLTNDITLTNTGYDRWQDWLFIVSIVITFENVLAVFMMIGIYLQLKPSFKGDPIRSCGFKISDSQNWTLSLLMERAFARYKDPILYYDDMLIEDEGLYQSIKATKRSIMESPRRHQK